jgi:RND superfamily putative drug exporter
LFDTLVVRSFMTPAIATLLGRWFWWPQRVRSRPDRRELTSARSVSRHGSDAVSGEYTKVE